MNTDPANIPRILIVDDDENVRAAVSQVFASEEKPGFFKDGLERLAGKIFARPDADEESTEYDLVFCLDLEKALDVVSGSVKNGSRFAVILLDMKMLSVARGLDCVEKIRKLDPMVNILILTADPGHDSAEISPVIKPSDKLFYVEKTFPIGQIKLLAFLLSTKWQSEGQLLSSNVEQAAVLKTLDSSLAARARELQYASLQLDALRHDLQSKKEIITNQAGELENSAVAMKVMLKNIATEDLGLDDKVVNRKIMEMDEKIILNVKELVEPFLERLADTGLDDEQQEYLAILRNNLNEITSPVMQRLCSTDYGLTPSEMQVANLVRQGKSSKNIATLLNLSVRTIDFHRDKIRKKLGIKDRRTSLKAVLNSFPVGMVDGQGS